MKISILTVKGSDYAYRILNYARHINFPIHSVFVIDYSFVKKINLIKSMYVRKLGYMEAIPIIIQRIIKEMRRLVNKQWNGKELIRDYKLLAENVLYTNDENNPEFIERIRSLEPDILLLGQIGIIRKNVLSIPKIATLNAHAAWLPEYRGNDVAYWTIYFKDFDKIGYTIHYVDEGADTGDIIKFVPYPPVHGDTIPKLIDRLCDESAKALVEMAMKLSKGIVEGYGQSKKSGRTYYAMPLPLRRFSENNLQKYLINNIHTQTTLTKHKVY